MILAAQSPPLRPLKTQENGDAATEKRELRGSMGTAIGVPGFPRRQRLAPVHKFRVDRMLNLVI
jgi:hypothetical protein